LSATQTSCVREFPMADNARPTPIVGACLQATGLGVWSGLEAGCEQARSYTGASSWWSAARERVGRALSATQASCVREFPMADNARPTPIVGACLQATGLGVWSGLEAGREHARSYTGRTVVRSGARARTAGAARPAT